MTDPSQFNVLIDYETYYDKDYGIKTLGPIRYIEDDRFDAYMVSLVGTDKYGRHIEWVGEPDDAPWSDIEGCTWWSHNATFDAYIWVYQSQFRASQWGAGPCDWFCSANLAVYCRLPRSLAGAVKQGLGLEGSKDPRSWAQGKTAAYIKELGKWDYMCEYCLDDSRLALQLVEKYAQYWPRHERLLGWLTGYWGWEGVDIDIAYLDDSIGNLEELLCHAARNMPWLDDGDYSDTPLSKNKMAKYLSSQGIPMPPSTAMDDPGALLWCEKYPDWVPTLEAIQTFRRVNKMLQLLRSIKRFIRPNGTMPYTIKYWGAHTGRWSGGSEKDERGAVGSLNLQNLYRAELFGVNVRKMFKGPMLVCDLNQIEPRVLHWLAGDTRTLELIATGMSPYEVHARLTMNYRDTRPLKEVDPAMYNLAKARVLGLGYGCGAEKFVSLAASYGVDLVEEQSRRVVNAYRNSNPKIVHLWNQLDRGLLRSKADGFFEIELPSGRSMQYLDISVRNGRVSAKVQHGGAKRSYWGSMACENLTQAVARDVFAQNLLKWHEFLSENGLGRILWHVHDESITKPRAGLTARDLEDLRVANEQILGSNVDWMPGCPIAAKAKIVEHYEK